MPKINNAGATQLTNTVSKELADLHGSAKGAEKFRKRQHMPEKPKDGSAVVQERTLIMNDMHIGIGRDPVSGNVYPGEDFTAEQERKLTGYMSAEWLGAAKGNEAMTDTEKRRLKTALKNLTWESGESIDSASIADLNSSGSKYKLNWVLNGDVFDFLQTFKITKMKNPMSNEL